MKRFASSLISSTLFALLLTGCGPAPEGADVDPMSTGLSYAGGDWEGVAFTTGQVVLALDLASNASLELLDVEMALDARAAENILAARPILTMDELAEVSWVGPAALEQIRDFLPTWASAQSSTAVKYDGVEFTNLEAARALAAANDANRDALSSAGIAGAQANIILEGRPWLSLAQVAETSGIGTLTMERLRTLGQAYADEPLSLDAKLAAAKQGILQYWQNDFVRSLEWQSTFAGKSWDDVKAQVASDVAAFEHDESYGVYETEKKTTFIGRVWGLYTEADVDPFGTVTRVYVEID